MGAIDGIQRESGLLCARGQSPKIRSHAKHRCHRQVVQRAHCEAIKSKSQNVSSVVYSVFSKHLEGGWVDSVPYMIFGRQASGIHRQIQYILKNLLNRYFKTTKTIPFKTVTAFHITIPSPHCWSRLWLYDDGLVIAGTRNRILIAFPVACGPCLRNFDGYGPRPTGSARTRRNPVEILLRLHSTNILRPSPSCICYRSRAK
jgi:hypothetical protein